MIDPAKVALFVPSGLKDFKQKLFDRIGGRIEAAGGRTVRGDYAALGALPNEMIPIVGASPELRPYIEGWRSRGRTFCYWDRGYLRRVFATHLPRATSLETSYYRVHLNAFQMRSIRDVPSDRWNALKYDGVVKPWKKDGRHIVIAAPTRTYVKSHNLETWISDTLDALARVTDRQIIIRDKESKRSLQADLEGAHCLVAHGSIAAVEAVVLGCPVFVHPDSAASLVGLTDLQLVEKPIYPEREPWLRSLSYNQWDERELTDGTLFRMLE